MHTHHHYVRVLVGTSSIKWEIQTNPYQSQCNNDLKQQRDDARETSRNDKLRVAWEGMGNTRTRPANTAKRAPYMLTHHGHVRVLVCTVSIQWEIQSNPYQST